ncbi:hypothetical protein WBG78_12565 [Chryseolinea sp. T2]|uniref:hypothetical protein n=1 Tax=Chryseolinea sp. T2 TaxID=3129255 RepID=UPI003077F03F
MDFESYLTSKRIDSARFQAAEPEVWQSWRSDFGQMHPNSFTVQKLNLINPIRRKYQLTVVDPPKVTAPEAARVASAPVAKPVAPSAKPAAPVTGAAVKIPRPGMPKIAKPASAESTITKPASAEQEQTKPTDTDSKPSDSTPSVTGESAVPVSKESDSTDTKPIAENPTPPPVVKQPRPVIPRPVIKPKPKTD